MAIMVSPTIVPVLRKYNQGIKLDVGCGTDKQPDFVGMDYRNLPGVDIVHDLMQFPWPIPDNICSVVVASHILEHISPDPTPVQLVLLIQLLISKGLLAQGEVDAYIGEVSTTPRFIRVMDEIWRITKPNGQLSVSVPYAGSSRDFQDPTHVNHINEMVWAYFDPLEPKSRGLLYKIYKPKPWQILFSGWQMDGFMEVLLKKRIEDISYSE